MKVISLRWSGRFGHFRRAEANRDGLTYPLPPRTAIIGLFGAILGLPKDEAPKVLEPLEFAWGGAFPDRFWHKIKLRKDPPSALARTIKAKDKGTSKPERATLMNFEILLNPTFLVHAAIDDDSLFREVEHRIREGRWHFSPCLGLSELLARIEFVGVASRTKLPEGRHYVDGCCREDKVRLAPGGKALSVQLLRLPDSVDGGRNFVHRGYYLERGGQPLPVETAEAWTVDGRTLVFS